MSPVPAALATILPPFQGEAVPAQIDATQYFHFSIMQLSLVLMLTTVVAWGIAVWSERRKSRPLIEQERTLRLQAEVKRQDEAQRADEERAKASLEFANLSSRHEALTNKARQDADEAAKKIADLQAEQSTTGQKLRDAEAQLAAATTQVSSLEAALTAEKGRITAMQEALEAKQDLAKQLAQELSSTRNSFADERRAAQEREAELRTQLAQHEKQSASGQSMIDVVNAELEKTRAAQADLEKESTAKLAELQRKLAAADQKSALLQKEILALVGTSGNASEAAEAVTHAEELSKAQERAKFAEKRVAELESQLAQGDAGTRKRLREAEYKICELEYKLAQVDEGKADAS